MNDPRLADSAPDADHPRQRYDFREHIGSGGMADVYRARDTELGRDVAVKVFRADDDTVADLQRREREIRLLSRLNHPGLVRDPRCRHAPRTRDSRAGTSSWSTSRAARSRTVSRGVR